VDFSKNIFNKTNKSFNKQSMMTYGDDYDVYQAGLECLLILEEQSFEINKRHMQATYLGIKEQSVEILTEGFGDFIQSVIKFFKNMIDKFVAFMKNVFAVISAYLGNFKKFVDTHKEELKNIDPDFKVQGFHYTFKDSIPNMGRIENIISDYNNELSQLKSRSKAEVVRDRLEYTSESFYNKIRAEVLGKNGEVLKDELHTEAKKVFRNDSDTEEEIYVDSTYLKSIVDEYLQLSKILLDTLKEKERVVSIISSIKSFFEKSATVYYKDGAKYMSTTQMVKSEKGNSVVAGDKDETKYDGRRLDVTNVFFNYKYAQAKEIGNICINAMIEKVNALREATKFYGSTIRHAFVGSKKNISEVK
jgi:hypothetical protein